jgi:hypothetical protein
LMLMLGARPGRRQLAPSLSALRRFQFSKLNDEPARLCDWDEVQR